MVKHFRFQKLKNAAAIVLGGLCHVARIAVLKRITVEAEGILNRLSLGPKKAMMNFILNF
jgi:hypothetical protein